MGEHNEKRSDPNGSGREGVWVKVAFVDYADNISFVCSIVYVRQIWLLLLNIS